METPTIMEPKSHESDPHLSEKITTELTNLFEAVQPERLRKCIHELLFRYLMNSYEIQKLDFQRMISDLYMLDKFLTRADEEWR